MLGLFMLSLLIKFALSANLNNNLLLNSRELKPLVPSESYTHSLEVDEDDPNLYRLFWKLVDNEKSLQFELHCKTSGWVGFGLSPNGDMTGADIAMSWVDSNGKAHLLVILFYFKSPIEPI